MTQRVPDPVQGLAMRRIGNGQDRDVAALGGGPVIGAGDRTPRHLPLERFGGGARTLGIARTDDDRMTGGGPTHGEPGAFVARAAQNRNRRFHDERMSRARNPLRQTNVAAAFLPLLPACSERQQTMSSWLRCRIILNDSPGRGRRRQRPRRTVCEASALRRRPAGRA